MVQGHLGQDAQETRRAVPSALWGMAAWLVCQGLTAAGGFYQSRVKWVTRREGTALEVIWQRGASHAEQPSPLQPGSGANPA